MSDERTSSRSLSEIGHLFLSSVRERQTNGAPMPRRQPPERLALSVPAPPQMEIAIELDSAESAPKKVARQTASDPLDAEERLSFPPVCAILGAHLNGKQFDRAKEYARHLAGAGERVGLIEVDASEFRLMRFDPIARGAEPEMDRPATDEQLISGPFDARAMTDALEELSWDLDRWVLMLPNLRAPEARALLRDVNHWVLLSTCDHDGVVGCYRTLKGVAETDRPRLSLALVDAPTDREAEKVHRKLASVCGQFLEWPLESETPVRFAPDVAEHAVMCSRPSRDAAQAASGPQWQVLAGFLAKIKSQPESPEVSALKTEDEPEASEPMTRMTTAQACEPSTFGANSAEPQPTPSPAFIPPPPQPAMRWAGGDRDEAISEVIELPEAQSASASILAAILRNESANLLECPVTPPMCPEAKLAVTRDRRIVLLAAARQGLGELRSIARAYNWLIENYNLICMAMPQLAINPTAQPCLRLLIDHADLSAEILQPMLQSSTVTVQAYRRLRWGEKTGLLLEAA
jgi:hypothetical protein